MGSVRLPGKSMAQIYKNLSLLEMVMQRVLKSKNLDMIILATSTNTNCDPLVEIANSLGILVVRGSETNVLSRFEDAIRAYNPDAIVRICADNPLIDPEEIDKLVNYFEMNHFDYSTNNMYECGLPDGLGCEIVLSDVLLKTTSNVLDNQYREHVTKYITDHQDDFHIGLLKAEEELWYPDLKLDIDSAEDLERMKDLCSALPVEKAPYWTAKEIINIVRSENIDKVKEVYS